MSVGLDYLNINERVVLIEVLIGAGGVRNQHNIIPLVPTNLLSHKECVTTHTAWPGKQHCPPPPSPPGIPSY